MLFQCAGCLAVELALPVVAGFRISIMDKKINAERLVGLRDGWVEQAHGRGDWWLLSGSRAEGFAVEAASRSPHATSSMSCQHRRRSGAPTEIGSWRRQEWIAAGTIRLGNSPMPNRK